MYHDTWTPIFAITCETSVRNGRVTRRQFPIKPAGATTIHACQGSTYDKICIDMNVSSSDKFHRHPLTAKPFLRHAHYVAASRVRSLEGLQIIKWNPELITVNEDVQKHLDYLQKEKPLQLCYTPVYNLEGLMKCVFLNTRSLHKHISDVKSSHNIRDADLVILAETQLKSLDVNNDYQLEGHNIYSEMIKHTVEEQDLHMASWLMSKMVFEYWNSINIHLNYLRLSTCVSINNH